MKGDMEEILVKDEMANVHAAGAPAIIPQSEPTRLGPVVLFLCTGNYYRSRFAEHYFNYLAQQSGLSWRAVSRGLRLTHRNVGPIAECTVAALKERGAGIPTAPRMPLAATAQDFANAALIVAVKRDEHEPLMQIQFAEFAGSVIYWGVHDVDCAPVEEALVELEREVRSLIAQLEPNAVS